ncbi:hypothetical protein FAZ19_13785 [Sphingobacterium alkalisoli]|uniref:DUF4369 domain-containing protein n=1 Tax=Sphingobacterium alkalisoli TaxID=1874115 RepID=A0A4U0GYV0_9SPHI|nr:hypothetical protein [Sphingobacterium alkalisoli]TJY64278.1 hypothetical protein FAZ19_13785 [Sphingobacterium alkalisoli]GGH22740.1 hypothetical protein GCM10011418_29500 [Sphingobacterium alkalisoli]
MKYLLALVLLYLTACKNPFSVQLIGSLPIDSTVYVDVYDAISGKQIASDTIAEHTFVLKIDSIRAGIYTVVFSWERDILKPTELKRYARFGEEELPRYVLSKSVWLDPKESRKYTFSISEGLDQSQLEQGLLDEDWGADLNVSSKGDNFRLYQEFSEIAKKYSLANLKAKDSLKQIIYKLNESGDLESSRLLHQQLSALWVNSLRDSLVRAEVNFLKRNIATAPAPYIFYSLVNTQNDFDNYKEVYDALSPNVKETLAKRTSVYLK